MSDAAMVHDFDATRRYTYADYLEWEGPERYQLFNGEAIMMASPSVVHQALLQELSRQFGNFLLDKPCRVFAAPLDVRLFPKEDNSDDIVLQPDLLVVCDKDKLAKGSVNGVPDMIIEILSPSNYHHEVILKFNYYLEAGVREYWVIDPQTKKVQVHVYDRGHYITTLFYENDKIAATVLPGLEIALKDLWARSEGV